MKKISKIDWMKLLTFGLLLATLLGFLGRAYWMLDLFSHFRVQYFQIGLVLIGITLWKRRNKQALVLAAVICFNYALILPFYFGKPDAANVRTSRVMLMNINASNGNTEQVLNVIQTATPDLLLLEEVTTKWSDHLTVLDTKYPYRIAEVRDDCFGIMLLSKYPLSQSSVTNIGTSGHPSIVTTVHLPQGEISVIGTHPWLPIGTNRSRLRNLQLAALPQVVREQKHPVLLIGDLNTSPWSSYFAQLLRDSGLKNSMKGFGFQPSWPSSINFLRIPIDHVLYTPEIVIRSRAVGADVGSDHLPVIADFYFE